MSKKKICIWLFLVPEDRKTESSISVCRSVGGQNVRKQEIEEDSEDPDVEEVKDPEPQRSASPEPKLAAIPRSPENNIDCPICQGSFPVTEIEIHAAYCDGEVAVVHERRPEANSFQSEWNFLFYPVSFLLSVPIVQH